MRTIPAFPMDRPAPRPDARPTRRESEVFSIAPAQAAEVPTRVPTATRVGESDRRETFRSPATDAIDAGRPTRDESVERANTNREERLRHGDPERAPRGAERETRGSDRTEPRERAAAARTENTTRAADARETPTRETPARDVQETPLAKESRALSGTTTCSSAIESPVVSQRPEGAPSPTRPENAPARPSAIEPEGKAPAERTPSGAPETAPETTRAPQAQEPRGTVRIDGIDGHAGHPKSEASSPRPARPGSPSPAAAATPAEPRSEIRSDPFGRDPNASAVAPPKDPIARPVESNAGANSARAGDPTNASGTASPRAAVVPPPSAASIVPRPVEVLTAGSGSESYDLDSEAGERSDSATTESDETTDLAAPSTRAPRAALARTHSGAAESNDTPPAQPRATGPAVVSAGPETVKDAASTNPSAGPAGPTAATPPVLRAVPGLEMQLAVRARELLTKGRTEIRIRLDPPELGRVRIQLQIEDHRAVARIVTSSPEAAALLARDREELARAFQHHGFERVDVHIDADSENAAWDRNEGEGPNGRAPSEDAPASGTERSGAPRRNHSPSSTPSSRGVDLFV